MPVKKLKISGQNAQVWILNLIDIVNCQSIAAAFARDPTVRNAPDKSRHYGLRTK